jgi:hypothetical protein
MSPQQNLISQQSYTPQQIFTTDISANLGVYDAVELYATIDTHAIPGYTSDFTSPPVLASIL